MSDVSHGAQAPGAASVAPLINHEASREGLKLVLRVIASFVLMLTLGIAMMAGPDEWLSQSEVQEKIEKISDGMLAAAAKAFQDMEVDVPALTAPGQRTALVFKGSQAHALAWTSPKLVSSTSFGDTIKTSVLARMESGRLVLIDFEISTQHLINCAEEPGDCLMQTGFQLIGEEQAQQWMADRPEFTAQVFESAFGHKPTARRDPS